MVALAVVGAALLGVVRLRSADPAPDPATDPADESFSVPSDAPVPPRPTAAPSRTARSEPSPGPEPQRDDGGTPARPAAPAKRPAPVQLSIPSIGVSQRLLRLGLQKDRTVEVPAPSDAEYPGWYELGTAPGELGSAVILGHVDSPSGPAVFYELRSLERGDRVDVRLEDGRVARFAVEDVATYPNEEFPARKVYTSQGYRGLNLVTCGGEYDKARGGYQSNVVAFARWTSTSPAA